MKSFITKKIEYFMIVLVSLKAFLMEEESERIRYDYSLLEEVGRRLFNIHFDCYDVAKKIIDNEQYDLISGYDFSSSYGTMIKQGAVKLFRETTKQLGYDWEFEEIDPNDPMKDWNK